METLILSNRAQYREETGRENRNNSNGLNIYQNIQNYSGTWLFYLMDFLGLRLGGTVGAPPKPEACWNGRR